MRRAWMLAAAIFVGVPHAQAVQLSLTCTETRGSHFYSTQIELNSDGGISIDGVRQTYSSFVWNANVISFWTPVTGTTMLGTRYSYWKQWTINRVTGILDITSHVTGMNVVESQQCSRSSPSARKF